MIAVATPHQFTERKCEVCGDKMEHLSDLPMTARFAAVKIYRCLSCNCVRREAWEAGGTAIEGSVFTVSPARCAMCFTTEEAVVKHGTHERRKTAALSAKGELEEPFSAPTFGRTATAPMYKLRSPLDFTPDRTSAARI